MCYLIHTKSNKYSALLIVSALMSIYLYRLKEDSSIRSIFWIQIFWIYITVFITLERHSLRHTFPCVWMCIITLFLRPWNVVLIPGFYFSSRNLLKSRSSLFVKVMSHIWLTKVFYFAQVRKRYVYLILLM